MALTKATNRMISGSYVNINDFGAVGDGVANDAAAIQSAIDFVAADPNGGIVYMPRGSYNLGTTSLSFPIAKSISLIGAGASSSGDGVNQVAATRLTYTGTSEAIKVHGTGFDANQCGGSLRDFYILGPGAGGATRGISIKFVSGSTGRFSAHNVFVDRFNIGWKLDAVLDVSFENCHSRGCSYGWYFDPASEAVNANTFSNCGDDSSVVGWYMKNGANNNRWFGGLSQGNEYGIYIYGETFGPKANMFYGYYLESAVVGSIGVLIEKAGPSTEPAGNRFFGGLFSSHAIGFDIRNGNDNTLKDAIFLDYYDRVLTGQIPIKVGAGTTNFISDNNYNESGNNSHSYASAGAGLVVNEFSNNNFTSKIYGSSGELFRVQDGYIAVADGITAPSTVTGMAAIYVDTADGDLKVKFSDGTVKTIVTDT